MKKMLLSACLFVLSPFVFSAVTTGEKAPDFALKDSEGQSHTLSQYKGKFVVLEWVNHGCPFVKKHYGSNNMQTLQKEFTAKGVIWLSVCSSAEGKQGHLTPAEWKEKITETGSAATAVLLDAPGAVGKRFGAKTTPHLFLIDPKGVVIYQGAIDDNPSADPADVLTAKNYIRAALTEALAGKKVSTPETKPYGCGVKYK